MVFRKITLPLSPLCCAVLSLSLSSAAQKDYMTQSYIDSTVQMAFYGFHSAQEVAGADFQMKRAIVAAKDVVAMLKRMSKGNINEKYILWKVSELESQIWLEEKELLLRQLQKDQVSVNTLIDRFNTELGKQRPDFQALKQIIGRVENIDPGKAGEMLRAGKKRSVNVSRELLFSIEKSLVRGELEQAREEIAYARRNFNFLTIGAERFAKLESEIEAWVSAGDRKAQAVRDLEKAKSLLMYNRLGEAASMTGDLRTLCAEIRAVTAPDEWERLNGSVLKIDRSIAAREDSLVNENLSILKTQGVNAGIAYFEDVVKKCGVRNEKMKIIDDAIMAAAPYRSAAPDEKVSEELDGLLSEGIADEELTMEAVRREARRRADSTAAVAAEKARRVQLELARRDSIRAAQLAEKERVRRQEQETARGYMVQVYDFLDNGRARKAYRTFKKYQEYVRGHSEPETFLMLETTVLQAYSDRRSRRSRRRAAQTEEVVLVAPRETEKKTDRAPPPSPPAPPTNEQAVMAVMSIYELLEKEDAAEANALFGRTQQLIRGNVSQEVFDMLRASVEQSYAQEQESRHRDEAKQMIARIYELLEQSRINEAFGLFMSHREQFKKFAGAEPYAMLEQIVLEAYRYVNTGGSETE